MTLDTDVARVLSAARFTYPEGWMTRAELRRELPAPGSRADLDHTLRALLKTGRAVRRIHEGTDEHRATPAIIRDEEENRP